MIRSVDSRIAIVVLLNRLDYADHSNLKRAYWVYFFPRLRIYVAHRSDTIIKITGRRAMSQEYVSFCSTWAPHNRWCPELLLWAVARVPSILFDEQNLGPTTFVNPSLAFQILYINEPRLSPKSQCSFLFKLSEFLTRRFSSIKFPLFKILTIRQLTHSWKRTTLKYWQRILIQVPFLAEGASTHRRILEYSICIYILNGTPRAYFKHITTDRQIHSIVLYLPGQQWRYFRESETTLYLARILSLSLSLSSTRTNRLIWII